MHRVFISYHHEDQPYKDALADLGERHRIFLDKSVELGDDLDRLGTDEAKRARIRDDFLRDSTVTIVLIGKETRHRKFVDWEISSSMWNGSVNKKSGILGITLPTVQVPPVTSDGSNAPDQLGKCFTIFSRWIGLDFDPKRNAYKYFPERLTRNLQQLSTDILVVPWDYVHNRPGCLSRHIDWVCEKRWGCDYDHSLPLKTRNGEDLFNS